jgi:bacillithiol biosynthesis deacetylase BshB1
MNPSDPAVDVLAFGAHPDDVEIFCGGTLVRLAQLGYRTAVVDLTRGERASNGTPAEREAEAREASAVLGLQWRENLELPDTGIDPWSADQVQKVVGAIRRARPELLLIPWVEERHPDHAAAGMLLGRAAFFCRVEKFETIPPSARHAPQQVLSYAMRHRMVPTFIVDTSAAAERKRQAIACYRSQVSPGAGAVPTLVGGGALQDAIDARDRYHGSMIGTSHGEALRAAGVLGVLDPVALFRQNPLPEPQAFEPSR